MGTERSGALVNSMKALILTDHFGRKLRSGRDDDDRARGSSRVAFRAVARTRGGAAKAESDRVVRVRGGNWAARGIPTSGRRLIDRVEAFSKGTERSDGFAFLRGTAVGKWLMKGAWRIDAGRAAGPAL